MRIDVTQEDIDAGVRKSAVCCPIANALCRAGLVSPSVTRSDASWFPAEKRLRFVSLPPQACSFVRDFDNGKPVSPFSFELEV